MRLRIALIQMTVSADKHQNVAHACQLIRDAAGRGAEIAILPEMFCCLYTNQSFVENAEPRGGTVWQAMADVARETGIHLVAGSMPERDDDRIFNTSFVFDPQGRQIARHRKMHLFDIDVAGGQRFFESDTFTAGRDVTVFDVGSVRIGLCVCFDMRFPELARLMALQGAQIIIVPAAFNMTTGPAHWEIMFRERAVDNQVFTVGVAPARDEHGPYVSYGNSIACSPWGDVVRRAGADEWLEVVDLDLAAVSRVRAQLPLLSARREDLYELKERSK